jgi:pimeloyl-ACP methyl ester carboxylesterase
VPTPHGVLRGWVSGEAATADRRVLLLHGGPGLSYDYLDVLAGDIGPGWTIAAYQQRGLEPSTLSGPFDLETAVADIAATLDALSWDRAVLLGHSWGGHLALHAALTLSPRLVGVLAVDPLGAVADGGAAEFGAALAARTPAADRARAEELDERAMRGEGTEAEMIESLRLFWPAYFAVPAEAPPMPSVRSSLEAYAGLWESLQDRLPELEAALPTISLPLGVVLGADSPMPMTAGSDLVSRVPGAWLVTVEGAGHFPWYERPGRITPALERLTR